MPRLEIPVGRSPASSFRSGGMWAGRHFPPARCQWEGRTQDVVMRLEPSSHSKALPSSPPSLSCCSLRIETLWNIPPSSNHRGNLRVPPAAAPGHRASPQGSRARLGPGTGNSARLERGNRRVRLCPAAADKVPPQSYPNPGSCCPQPQSSQETSHHPQHVLGGLRAQIWPSPGTREGLPWQGGGARWGGGTKDG